MVVLFRCRSCRAALVMGRQLSPCRLPSREWLDGYRGQHDMVNEWDVPARPGNVKDGEREQKEIRSRPHLHDDLGPDKLIV